jgi:hypothetical protein
VAILASRSVLFWLGFVLIALGRITVVALMVVAWIVVIGLGVGALYGLHRLALWMEDRGHIYYLNKRPKSSPLGSLIAFQRAIEPRANYVVQAEQVNQEVGEEGASGQGDPDEPDAEPCDDDKKRASGQRIVGENDGEIRVYSKDTGYGDSAPKGPNKSAQGNALGPRSQTDLEP